LPRDAFGIDGDDYCIWFIGFKIYQGNMCFTGAAFFEALAFIAGMLSFLYL